MRVLRKSVIVALGAAVMMAGAAAASDENVPVTETEGYDRLMQAFRDLGEAPCDYFTHIRTLMSRTS